MSEATITFRRSSKSVHVLMAGVIASLSLGTLAGCSSGGQRRSGDVVPDSAPSLAEARNATYRGVNGIPFPITLVDGRWEGEPVVDGGAARPSVHLADDFRLAGDLDGSGTDEAVVLLGQSSGGTGTNVYVAIAGRVDGEVSNRATALVGDRVQVRDARIENRRIVLDVVQPGPADAMCCPGELATRAWVFDDGRLSEALPAVVEGRLSLDTVADAEWVLRAWAWDEPASNKPEVTLTFSDGRFAGSAGCNRYFASASAGSSPGDVTVGQAGATRKACSDSIMATEDRFLKQLAGVRKFGFVATRLALTFERDGVLGTMLFDRRPLDSDARR
jgi:heat shock protein HslJ